MPAGRKPKKHKINLKIYSGYQCGHEQYALNSLHPIQVLSINESNRCLYFKQKMDW